MKKSSPIEIIAVAVVAVLLVGVSFILGGMFIQRSAVQVAMAEPPVEATSPPESTSTPMPTATLAPIDTPAPTATPEPTNTPEPTRTPEPTSTPELTSTPVPTYAPAPTYARSSGISLTQYNQLRDGMTYAEIVNILGRAGKEVSSSSIGGSRTVMYEWSNSDYSTIMVMFDNNRIGHENSVWARMKLSAWVRC